MQERALLSIAATLLTNGLTDLVLNRLHR